MDYPQVLGTSIKIMPTQKRSIEWFNQQPDPIRRQFWGTLAKCGDFLAAEYLRNNSVAVEPLAPAPRVFGREHNAKIAKAFTAPLTVSGAVVGELWPTGISIMLPIPRYYSYRSFTSEWAYIGVVTTCKGDRMTYPSCSADIASQNALKCARRFARNGNAIGHIKAELFEVILKRVETTSETKISVMMAEDEARLEYLRWTNVLLPSIAVKRGFPVIKNHCFQRIVLDNLFGGCWYDFLEEGKIPAYRQLSLEQLQAAIVIAQGLSDSPIEHIQALNAKSMQWREEYHGRN